MKKIEREVPSENKSRQGRTKWKIGIGITVILLLIVFILYEKFFAHADNIRKTIEEQLGEPIHMIQITKGDTTIICASEASCEKVLDVFGKLKGHRKDAGNADLAAAPDSARYYEKEDLDISFIGGEKICTLYQANEIKSNKSMRMVCGESSRNYLLNKNINEVLQEILEEKQSAPYLGREELLQFFDDATGKIKEDVTLEDFEKYRQINVENNGEETCLKISMEDSGRIHVIFKSAGLTGLSKDDKPEKVIVFWSDSEYISSDREDFLESIKEK